MKNPLRPEPKNSVRPEPVEGRGQKVSDARGLRQAPFDRLRTGQSERAGSAHHKLQNSVRPEPKNSVRPEPVEGLTQNQPFPVRPEPKNSVRPERGQGLTQNQPCPLRPERGQGLTPKHPSRIRQRGYNLVSVLLALAVGAIILRGQIEAKNIEDQQQAGKLQGEILDNLKAAVNNYILEQYLQLQNALPVTKAGVTLADGTANGQTLAPTVAQFITMGYLPPGYNPTPLLGQGAGALPNYRVLLTRIPAGCAAQACNITGQLWIDQPVLLLGTNEINGIQMGALVQRVGADALVSTNVNTTQLVGPTGVGVPNPDPTGRGGIVGTRVGSGTSGFGQYVTVNDPRNLNFGGRMTVAGGIGVGSGNGAGPPGPTGPCNLIDLVNSGEILVRSSTCMLRAYINNNNNFNNGGEIGVADANGTVRGRLGFNAAGQSQLSADGVVNNAGNAGLRSDGTVFGADVQTSALTATGVATLATANVTTATVTTATVSDATLGGATLNATAALNTACNPDGRMAWLSLAGRWSLARCTAGVWTAGGGLPVANAGDACTPDGSVAATAAGEQLICSGGFYVRLADRFGRMIAAETYRVSDSGSVPRPVCASGFIGDTILLSLGNEQQTIQNVNRYAQNAGTSWTIYLRDGNNVAVPGDAVATTYCIYS